MQPFVGFNRCTCRIDLSGAAGRASTLTHHHTGAIPNYTTLNTDWVAFSCGGKRHSVSMQNLHNIAYKHTSDILAHQVQYMHVAHVHAKRNLGENVHELHYDNMLSILPVAACRTYPTPFRYVRMHCWLKIQQSIFPKNHDDEP